MCVFIGSHTLKSTSLPIQESWFAQGSRDQRNALSLIRCLLRKGCVVARGCNFFPALRKMEVYIILGAYNMCTLSL